MLRRSVIAMVTVAACAVSFNSAGVSAATHGGGSHAQGLVRPLFNRHFPGHARRARAPFAGYDYLPYGGLVGADMSPYYSPDAYSYFTDPIAFFSMLGRLENTMPRLTPLGCKHSVETKTVPSEDGGDRQIKITRC